MQSLTSTEIVDKIDRYEVTGYIRWESILHFYTIDCMKAGFLRKSKGLWILTEEGEEAIKLGPEKLLVTATKIYREWDAKRKKEKAKEEDDSDIEGDKGQAQKALLSQYEENVFFVPHDARWKHLLSNAKQPNIGKIVDDAMDSIEEENTSLKGVLPKVYARQNLDPTTEY